MSPGIPRRVQTGLQKCTSRVCSAAVLQTVAGVQGDDVVSQTQRHIIYITHADTATGGAHLAGTGENGLGFIIRLVAL